MIKHMFLVRYVDTQHPGRGIVIPGSPSLFEIREEAECWCTEIHKKSNGAVIPFFDELQVGNFKKSFIQEARDHWKAYWDANRKMWVKLNKEKSRGKKSKAEPSTN